MAKELAAATVFAYPCDTVRYTEGFSVSILDACAAGCVPIISDADAIGEVYAGVAHVIQGKPATKRKEWVDTISKALTDAEFRKPIVERAKAFASKQSRQIRALQWESTLIPKIVANDMQEMNLEFRGAKYKAAYRNTIHQHPSWFSHLDEESVREDKWRPTAGDLILDVGAAYGSYSLAALSQGAAMAYAWSPEGYPGDEDTERDYLLASAKLNGWEDKIEVYDDGVYDQDGWVNTLTQHFSETKPENDDPQNIKVRSLDSWASDKLEDFKKYPRTLMKLDVEGAEVHVLRGAEKLIRTLRPDLLIENHIFKAANLEVEVRELLTKEFGYREVSTTPYHSVSHSLYTPA
jgi:FkbM family methyltransferase